MNVTTLLFSDFVQGQNNKFTLVGAGFNEIRTKKLPCIHRQMFIFARFQAGISDIGRNKVEIRIVGEQGRIFGAEFDLEVNEDQREDFYLNMPIEMNNLKFEAQGKYQCEILINGTEKAHQELKIICTNPQAV